MASNMFLSSEDEIPLSIHVDELMNGLVSGETETVVLKKFLEKADAFMELSSEDQSEAQLPPLEWNRHFRKAYTVLAWIRAECSTEEEPPRGTSATTDEQSRTKRKRRQLLYRFSSTREDNRGAGICAMLSDWTLTEEGDTNKLHSTVTAFLLPTMSQQTAMTHASLLQIPLVLPANQWCLLGISHVYPYLKKTTLTLSINGSVVASGELSYPVVDNNVVMEYSSLFTNMGLNGVVVQEQQNNTAPLGDDDTSIPASQLAQPQGEQPKKKKLQMKWQVASLALYPDVIPSTLQSLCADAGVALSLQQNGRMVVSLPPIANSSKGTSLHGSAPSVGIALSVTTPEALELQHYISRAVLYVSACNCVVLKTRIACPFVLNGGHFESTPKVGLMQPSVPLTVEAAVHFVHSRVHHALSDYLLESSTDVNLAVADTCHQLSVVWSEHYLVESLVLPLFLSLCPPGYPLELQMKLYQESLKQLYNLYNGKWAATLLDLLVVALQHQGARCHEQVLQGGLIPILSSTLRRSLVRAQLLKVKDYDTIKEFLNNVPANEPAIHPAQCPKRIPTRIAQACADLIGVCCGPPSPSLERLSAHHQVRRQSDLAMTAVFGLGLDLDLWGAHVPSSSLIMGAIAERYGGRCVAYGSILRNQIPVQSLLDMIRIRLNVLTEELESTANSLSQLLVSMLLSSLSNKRNIVMAEHDVLACIGALSDCALGTVSAHVILTALHQILEYCDIVASGEDQKIPDDSKLQVANRLGRNLLMGQYHDVLAPMLLSRTVFCGERVLAQSDAPHLWQYHWRLSLLLFVWVSSISGPEGAIAARSTGSLLFASGLAGSLRGCLVVDKNRDSELITSLLLPPPALALMANNGSRNQNDDSWTYTDLLSDRLQVIVPLLPGLIVSLISHPADVSGDTPIAPESMEVLSDLLSAVSSSFRRVYGGLPDMQQQSFIVKAAKDNVPHLLMVIMLLESHIYLRKSSNEDTVVILTCRKPPKSNDGGDWVDVASNDIESVMYGSPAKETGADKEVLAGQLAMCQRMVMNALTDLITSAMRLGGGEAATSVWRSVIATLNDSVLYGTVSTLQGSGAETTEGEASTIEKEESSKRKDLLAESHDDFAQVLSQNMLCRIAAIVLTKVQERSHEWELWSPELSAAASRLCSLVEEKNLLQRPFGGSVEGSGVAYSRDQVLLLCALIDVLAYGREMTGWCQLILPSPPTLDGELGSQQEKDIVAGVAEGTELSFSPSGSTGKFSPPPRSKGRGLFIPPESPSASSRSLLPVLHPTLRAVLGCLGSVNHTFEISIPQVHSAKKGESSEEPVISLENVKLLNHMASELQNTLTAAIVGLSFPNSRDIALSALACLRRAMSMYKNGEDAPGVDACASLFIVVVEEIRVRYEGERRLREKALFDAYHDDGDDSKGKFEAEASREVERLILGGDLIPQSAKSNSSTGGDSIEEVHFSVADDQDAQQPQGQKRDTAGVEGEDFILFHGAFGAAAATEQQTGDHNRKEGNTMGFTQYAGLGSTLEECKILKANGADGRNANSENAEALVGLLSPFLDTWDENSARDAAESELVELFDTSTSIDWINTTSGTLKSPKLSTQVPIFGSETAADAMTTFIEISSGEKSRLNEVISNFMPSHRDSCISYAERVCWARYMEIPTDGTEFSMDRLWERGVADGNRDIRSRLISMPCKPQFPRHIPSYLDNTSSVADAKVTGKPEAGAAENAIDEDDIMMRSSITQLMAAGNIEIVDITKKEVDEDELPDVWEERGDLADESENPMLDEGGNGFQQNEDGSDEKQSVSPETEGDLTGRAVDKAHLSSFRHHIASSAFSDPPDNSASMLSLLHSATPGVIEEHFDNCVHVKTEGSRKCTLLLSSTYLILEYDADSEGWFEGEVLAEQEEADRRQMIKDSGGGKEGASQSEGKDDQIQLRLQQYHKQAAALRPKSIRWNLSELSHVYLRRYRLRDSALEMFFLPSGGSSFGGFGLFSPGTSLFIDFGSGREGNISRDDAAHSIMRRAPPQAITQWPDRSPQFLHDQLSRLTLGWVDGRITNFDYLLHLNMLAGRSYNDLCQYPVMPWVLSNYNSEEIPDLTDMSNFRDLSKPMGALNPKRLDEFIERFESFSDPTIPPFMYGSHYSTSAGVVLHFLVRMHPFAGLHRQLQGGHFDVADRLFSSVPRTWEMCTGSSAAEVKELTPEWYCNPAFLKNTNKFKLGTSQEGELLGEVLLPPWANESPEKFVEVMRNALESDICSEMLPDWIDLIFGRKQQGPEAIKAHNVFFYLTYYGSVDVASIEDEALRSATELQIAHFGQCPMQLFRRPHVRRVQRMRHFRKHSFYQMLSAYTQGAAPRSRENGGDEDSGDDDILLGSPRSFKKKDGSQRIFGEPLVLPFFSAPMSHWVHLEAPPPGPHAALIALRLAGMDRVLAVDAQGIFHSFRWAWKADILDDDSFPPNLGPVDKGCFVAQRELPRFRTVPRIPHVPPKKPGEENARAPAVAISKTLFAARSVLLVLSDGDGRGALSMQLVDPAKGNIKGEAMVPAVHSSHISCIAMDPIGTAAGHGGVGGELAIVGSADGGTSLWRFMSSHFLPLRPRVRMRGHGGATVQAVALSSAIHICASVSLNRCCIFSVGNGTMIRSFPPPQNTLELPDSVKRNTVFADTSALALSVQGFVVTVCRTTILSEDEAPNRDVITLHLFSLEGVSLGSKALESWRGVPHKITCTPDGTAISVCSGRGVTIHRLSAITPLEFIDEWHITEADELDDKTLAAWDVDFGPSLLRPVVAAAACSGGVLRLHALPGISPWSERHRKSTVSSAVGQALSRPAQRIKSAVGKGLGLGNKLKQTANEIGKEVSSDVKERGVGGFLVGTLFRKAPK